jgi:hypothetical protein
MVAFLFASSCFFNKAVLYLWSKGHFMRPTKVIHKEKYYEILSYALAFTLFA